MRQTLNLVLRPLAFAVRRNFAFIGRYPRILDCVQSIARIAGIVRNADEELVVIANGSLKPSILPNTLERLTELNRRDYLFLKLIGNSSPADQADYFCLV